MAYPRFLLPDVCHRMFASPHLQKNIKHKHCCTPHLRSACSEHSYSYNPPPPHNSSSLDLAPSFPSPCSTLPYPHSPLPFPSLPLSCMYCSSATPCSQSRRQTYPTSYRTPFASSTSTTCGQRCITLASTTLAAAEAGPTARAEDAQTAW